MNISMIELKTKVTYPCSVNHTSPISFSEPLQRATLKAEPLRNSKCSVRIIVTTFPLNTWDYLPAFEGATPTVPTLYMLVQVRELPYRWKWNTDPFVQSRYWCWDWWNRTQIGWTILKRMPKLYTGVSDSSGRRAFRERTWMACTCISWQILCFLKTINRGLRFDSFEIFNTYPRESYIGIDFWLGK